MSQMNVAVITTVYRPRSHADVIVSRWLDPMAGDKDWGWDEPQTRIASMYVDQFPDNDQARAKAAEHDIAIYSTIRQALTLGGKDLAVDAVLLIGEHGEYPFNALGQKLYPRKRLFDEVVEVFEDAGRVVPMFFDKHLSWDFESARQMYDQIKRLNIPFFGGSSLPYCRLDPPLNLPDSPVIDQAVCVYPDGIEAYLFHSLEVFQAQVEHQADTRRGITRIRAYQDDQVRALIKSEDFPRPLLDAALDVVCDEYRQMFDQRCEAGENPVTAFAIDFESGFQAIFFHVGKLIPESDVRRFTVALRLKDDPTIHAGRVVSGKNESFHGHFARLNSLSESMFLTGQPPIAVERLLVTTGATEGCMQALARPDQTLDTPHLRIKYA